MASRRRRWHQNSGSLEQPQRGLLASIKRSNALQRAACAEGAGQHPTACRGRHNQSPPVAQPSPGTPGKPPKSVTLISTPTVPLVPLGQPTHQTNETPSLSFARQITRHPRLERPESKERAKTSGRPIVDRTCTDAPRLVRLRTAQSKRDDRSFKIILAPFNTRVRRTRRLSNIAAPISSDERYVQHIIRLIKCNRIVREKLKRSIKDTSA